jgi:hypothetical protein
MRRFPILCLLGFCVAGHASQAAAAGCAAGAYRAGCVGPNGAVVTTRPAARPVHPAPVTCAAGVYRAGCVGPNGAVVTNRPPAVVTPHCYWRAGVKVCR